MNTPETYPVPVLEHPHWRVVIRPEAYDSERIPSLTRCIEVVEKTKVRLRGWDYPHLSTKDEQRGYGSNWVASWSDFAGHVEYWRLFQSGQFFHLFAVSEATEADWREQLRASARGHLGSLYPDIDWDQVPGFISIVNLLYTVTEIFEFAARLAQHEILAGLPSVEIGLQGIRGFILMAGRDRAWHTLYSASEDEFARVWEFASEELIANSANHSLDAVLWFLERFGWLSPPSEVLAADQRKFLQGRL